MMRGEGIWANTCLPKHIPVYGDDISVNGRSPWESFHRKSRHGAKIHVSQGHQHLFHLLPSQLTKHSSPSQRRLKVGDERGKSMWEQRASLFRSPVFNTRNSSQHGAIPFSCPLCHGLAVHPDKCW